MVSNKLNRKDVGGDVHAMKKDAKPIGMIVIAALFVALIVVGVVIAVILLKNNGSNNGRDSIVTTSTGGRGMVATPENIEQILEEIDKPVNDASYTCSMSMDWTFDKWDKPTDNVYAENYIDNTRTVYFDVYLDDENGDAIEDELIYSSPYLEVGAEIKKFALQKQVPAGEYTATVIYYLVDDNYNVITDVSVGIRLIIKG